jgi:hypothetical protein
MEQTWLWFGFNVFVLVIAFMGRDAGLEYFTGYLIEEALSGVGDSPCTSTRSGVHVEERGVKCRPDPISRRARSTC